MIWADLHCHTTCSDGTVTPVDLIWQAKAIGLHGLSITDHDTLEAYPIAIAAAQKADIRLGTGIEFSCQFEGESLHLLGYDFRLDNLEMQKLCERHDLRRRLRNTEILKKLEAAGISISYDELASKAQGKAAGRAHIAQLMVEKGFVKTIREAFYRYIGKDKPCFFQGECFDPQEAINIVHLAGGKAFIAHPQLLPGTLDLNHLLQLPFDGIECYYSRMAHNSWLEIAKTRSLLSSGGSDFHGTIRPEAELGCNGVDQATFERIFKNVL